MRYAPQGEGVLVWAVVAGGREISGEREAVLPSTAGLGLLARLQVPDPHGPIEATWHNSPPVVTAAHARGRAVRAADGARLPAPRCLPAPDRPVLADRSEARPVGAERHPPTPAVVTSEDREIFALLGEPEPHGPVPTGRSD